MNRRLWEFDALRGLMLVLMTVTHLPTRFSSPLGQPFGFVSAAEGFVMLSGLMAGMVYTSRMQRHGSDEMLQAFLKRAWKIYLCQAALLVLLFTVIAFIGRATQQDAIINLINFYLSQPVVAVVGSLLLLYNPPLLDILPMYIVFMLASPVLLLHGQRHGWGMVVTTSVLLWLGAQFGLGRWVYDAAVSLTALPVPANQIGSFDIFGWQFLWVLGLWLGSTRAAAERPEPIVFPKWMVRTAVVAGLTALVWRHAIGQVPFPDHDSLNLLLDKWHLGPLRLINFFVLVVLTMHFGPRLARWMKRPHVLEAMGAAALPVFCAHLLLALLLLALVGEPNPARPWAMDAVILTGSLFALYGVARASLWLDARTATARQRIKQQTVNRLSAWDRPRSGAPK